jgi:hypothetical protein
VGFDGDRREVAGDPAAYPLDETDTLLLGEKNARTR